MDLKHLYIERQTVLSLPSSPLLALPLRSFPVPSLPFPSLTARACLLQGSYQSAALSATLAPYPRTSLR